MIPDGEQGRLCPQSGPIKDGDFLPVRLNESRGNGVIGAGDGSFPEEGEGSFSEEGDGSFPETEDGSFLETEDGEFSETEAAWLTVVPL